LLAFFTNDGWMDLPGTYRGLLAALQAVLGAAGIPVRDAWYVGDAYWRDAYCLDQSCCPLPGRPIEDIRDSRLNAEMVFRGSSVGPAPEDAQPQAPTSGQDQAAMKAAEAAWSAQLDPRRRSMAQFNVVLGFWERLLGSPAGGTLAGDAHSGDAGSEGMDNEATDGEPPRGDLPVPDLPDGYVAGNLLPAGHQAFLRASLQVPAWRDAVLVMAAAGSRAALAGAEQFGIFDVGCLLAPVFPANTGLSGPEPAHVPDPAPVPGSLPVVVPGGVSDEPGYGEVLLGLEPALPDWNRLHHLDCILEQLSPWGGQASAAALTGRGWISWCRGRGSYAAAYLGQALEQEAGYRLAELMLELVRRGTLCGWAARKEAAWQKFEPDAA
jgi:hypothetical protein